MASESLFRLSIVSAFIVQIVNLLVVLLLYKLLKPVNKNLAVLMVIFLLVGIPIAMLNELNHFAVLLSGRRRRPIIRAGLRPPLKPSVQISRTGLSQRCASQHLANEGISEIRFTRPNSPYSLLSGNVFQPQHRQRL